MAGYDRMGRLERGPSRVPAYADPRRGGRRGRARDRRGLPQARPGHLSGVRRPRAHRFAVSLRAPPSADKRSCTSRVLDSPAMARNLVIVESPAKAKTIERYLVADFTVLASYGHVRDLPENPGKGKFGVDVDHDFAPEYVVPTIGASRSTRSPRRPSVPTRSTSRQTSTGKARRSPGTSPRRPTCPARTQRVTFNEITELPSLMRSPTRAGSTRTSSTPSRPGGSSTGSSATR